MRNMLLACAAAAFAVMPAPAQDLPKLSSFLADCARDTTICRYKIRDYINAADTQKLICRPNDESVSEAVSNVLSWLRSDDKHSAALFDQPYDDGLYEAVSKLYPCKDAAPPAEPPPAPAPAQ